MFEQGQSCYQRQKQEAKRILRKISIKRFLQVENERSEGFYIVDDLKDELRMNFKRSQTQKMYKRIRRKQMTQQFKKSMLQNQDKNRLSVQIEHTRRLTNKSINLSSKDLLKVETSKRVTRRISNIEKIEINKVLKEVVGELKNNQQYQKSEAIISHPSNNLDLQSNIPNSLDSNAKDTVSLNYTQCKSFLPMLQLYIQERVFMKTMSLSQRRVHVIIIQMLLLALSRRKNNKLIDALDILIEIDRYFPKNSNHMQELKIVWYLMIAKLSIELKNNEKKKAKRNRWQKTDKLPSSKQFSHNRRQNTFVIRSIASKKNFMSRVSMQMKKLQLIYQTSYQRQSSSYQNAHQDHAQQKLLISRVNKMYALSYPLPDLLFPKVPSIVNYGVIIINRDTESNLFPDNYPASLSHIISEQQYREVFCKINSILIPQNRCFNFQASLYANYQYVFGIFLVFFITAIIVIALIKRYVQDYAVVIIIIFSIIGISVLSGYIHCNNTSNIGKFNQIYLSINKILNTWSDYYEQDTIKFKLSEHYDMIIVSYPKGNQTQDIITSQYTLSNANLASRRGTFTKKSEQIMANQVDKIIEKDQSDESENSYNSQKQNESHVSQEEQPHYQIRVSNAVYKENIRQQQSSKIDLSVSSDEVVSSKSIQKNQVKQFNFKEALVIFDEFQFQDRNIQEQP